MGTYTPNYNLYMPEVGETGWGELVSNNFEIIDNAIGDGTRILSILPPNVETITISNFEKYTFYDENNVYYTYFNNNIIFESIPQPTHSCRLMIISVNGDLTINGNIDTYPNYLQPESPPNTDSSNTYTKIINFGGINLITLMYISNQNNSQISMNYNDYLNLIYNKIPTTSSNQSYILSIPAAIAAGGRNSNNSSILIGTAGTSSNTCNGGGGGCVNSNSYTGGTGCIFGQYSGGNTYSHPNGYGYGDVASNKYRCGLIFVVNGNITINENCTITQTGGNGSNAAGGYGGGIHYIYGINSVRVGGGGGAPVFIYYTGSYVNNGTITTSGGNSYGSGGSGGAGGIKVTKISI